MVWRVNPASEIQFHIGLIPLTSTGNTIINTNGTKASILFGNKGNYVVTAVTEEELKQGVSLCYGRPVGSSN